MDEGQATNTNIQIPASSQPGQVPTPQVINNAPMGSPQVIPQNVQPAGNPNSTQNALLISEIRDGIVIMNDGTFRAVIMCRSINFDLMSPQEREAVEFSYQGFLNSLYFPVQIFIRSQKVDLRPYLEKLVAMRAQQSNMLLGLLIEDYLAFLSQISQETNIMDKKFYLTIQYPEPEQKLKSAIKQGSGFFTGLGELIKPKKEDHIVIDEAALDKAKTELRNRVQAAMQGLMQCGVQSAPLDTQELIELFYDAYNPDTATRQQLKNFGDLATPVVTKGSGEAPQTAQAGGLA